MLASVCKTIMDSKVCHDHKPSCVWEKNTDHTDAKLLQQSVESFAIDVNQTALEKDGLTATLKLRTELCKAAESGSVADTSQGFSLGELSRYVGYEYLLDNIPVWSLLEVETPDSMDF